MLKRRLTPDEQYGLTQEEIKHATRWLRKYKTRGVIPDVEAAKLFDAFMIGCSFYELNKQYPQYPLPQIIFTAAYRKWIKDRERIQYRLKDVVAAKVVKTYMEQSELITSLLSVSYVENIEAMRKYIADPINNPLPPLKIDNLKQYKEILEAFQKLINFGPKEKGDVIDRFGIKEIGNNNKEGQKKITIRDVSLPEENMEDAVLEQNKDEEIEEDGDDEKENK